MIIVPSNVTAKRGVSALVATIPVNSTYGFPRWPIINSTGTRVYVSTQNFGSSYAGISVINTSTNAEIAWVQGPYNANATKIAISPNDSFVYQGLYSSNNIAIYRTSDNVYTGNVGTYGNGWGLTVNPASTKIYAAYPIAKVAGTFTIPDGIPTSVTTGTDAPWDCAMHPDGTKVYYNCAGNVRVLNTSTFDFTASIPVTGGNAQADIKVTPNGSKVYAVVDAYADPAQIVVINTATNAVTQYITLTLGSASGLAISPDSSTLYVTHQTSTGGLTVIDTATNTVSSVISPVPSATGCVVSPDGSTVYTAHYNATVPVSGGTSFYVGVIK